MITRSVERHLSNSGRRRHGRLLPLNCTANSARVAVLQWRASWPTPYNCSSLSYLHRACNTNAIFPRAFIIFIRTYLFLHFPTYVMTPPPPTVVAVAAFANMFSVGTVFAPSTVQFELPRLLPDISSAQSLVPFAAACLGLSTGTRGSASPITGLGSHAGTAFGTALWVAALTGTGYVLQLGPISVHACLLDILATLTLGSIGVRLTYLAVIVMVGQGPGPGPVGPTARPECHRAAGILLRVSRVCCSPAPT